MQSTKWERILNVFVNPLEPVHFSIFQSTWVYTVQRPALDVILMLNIKC
jgi:hypothetical protein